MNGGDVIVEVECVRIGSVTYANKAKEILKAGGIRSRMKKVSNEFDGCAYLLEMDNKLFDKAISILRENEINFTRCDYR